MLVFQKVTEKVEHAHFDCGNPGIEEQIRDSYFATLLREGYAYEIIVEPDEFDPIVVGYFMIKLVTVTESQIPEEDLECYSAVYAKRPQSHAAVEITYLAVDRKMQGRHIGTSALKLLVSQLQRNSEEIPIRYIVLDALKEKVEFYKKRGFQTLGTPDEESETQYMYMDCLRDKTELNEYLSRF